MSKFQVGDKVRLLANGYGGGSTEAGIVGEIIPYRGERGDYQVKLPEHRGGVGFYEYELELITEGGAPVTRRTFKLIKDAPTVKRGAIYQEASEFDDLRYVLLDNAYHKGNEVQGQLAVYDRSLVEDQPTWFVEVFQVEPQYMTREELDKFDAFKKTLAPARKTRMKATTKAVKKTAKKVAKAA